MANVSVTADIIARDKTAAAFSSAARNGAALGTALGQIAAKGISAVAGFAKQSIAAASDYNESLSKTQAVFGSSADSVVKWAQKSATSMGQSKQAALEAAGTFGNFLTAMDLAKPVAASMSKSIVGLAGDLASFNNANPADVLEALRSGMAGEAEPLRKYGVQITALRVQSEALAKGIIKPRVASEKLMLASRRLELAQQKATEAIKKHGASSKQAAQASIALTVAEGQYKKEAAGKIPLLTAQQKALATYSIIMRDTKTAQGDFSRTSKGLANQQRILAARFDNLKVTVGSFLLPLVLKAVNAFNSLTKFVKNNATTFKVLAAIVAGFVAGLVIYNTTVKVVTTVTKAWAAIQAIINGEMVANPIGLVVVAIAALAAGLIYAYKHSETFRRIVDATFKDIAAAATFMWDKVLRPLLKMWADVWLAVVGVLVHGAAAAFGWVPGLGGKLKTAAKEFDKFKNAVNKSLDGVKDKTVTVGVVLGNAGATQGDVDVNKSRRLAGGQGRVHGGDFVVQNIIQIDGKTQKVTETRYARTVGAA